MRGPAFFLHLLVACSGESGTMINSSTTDNRDEVYMNQGNEFNRLEEYVGKLLAQYEQLLAENSKLYNRIAQMEEEIGSLQKEVNSADSERGDISSRIKGLIDKIEEWEATLSINDESVDQTVPEKAEVDDEILDEEFHEEVEEDKERNQQQNLFNVQPRASN